MAQRGGVRSSARLSGEAGAAGAARAGARPEPPERSAAAAAAAAQRRARAAERAREVEDSPRVLRDKCRRLARALRNAKHLVVYTGAGISTAADIPDYRGPHGVWTRLQRGERVGRVEVSRARPTFTHMALTAMWARGALKFVVSQNCDGLHVRAGLPRRALAELHGDMFAERCARCRQVYLRAFDTTERTARHAHATRRLCHACGAELADSIVHFGERGAAAWPLNWAGALRHAAAADVVLCLGSSLKVLRRYPRLWRMQAPRARRPDLYIVNLQWTPKDAVAALKINARCDAVMRLVARRLRLRVPRYRLALDPLPAHAEPLAPPEAHTASRRPLPAPPLLPPPRAAPPDADSDGSDSDEDVPLRRLADRLRAPAAPRPRPPPPPPLPPPSLPPPLPPPPPADRLRAFRVQLATGDATVLLRARHAPPPSPPPACRPALSDLRRFRMVRRPPDAPDAPPTPNGRTTSAPGAPLLNGTAHSRLRRLLQCEPKIESDEAEAKPKLEKTSESEGEEKKGAAGESSESGSEEGGPGPESREAREARAARLMAACLVRRALAACRGALWGGLGGPGGPGAPGAGAECAWCMARHGARRCLWYGPPRCTPLGARAWRRARDARDARDARGARGARYLCACCGPDAAPAPDTGGWYGKGYRKGRRRR